MIRKGRQVRCNITRASRRPPGPMHGEPPLHLSILFFIYSLSDLSKYKSVHSYPCLKASVISYLCEDFSPGHRTWGGMVPACLWHSLCQAGPGSLAQPLRSFLSHSSTTCSLQPLSTRIKLLALNKPKKPHKKYDTVPVLMFRYQPLCFPFREQTTKPGTQQELNKFHSSNMRGKEERHLCKRFRPKG